MFKKKKEHNTPPIDHSYDDYDSFYNTYPDQNYFNYSVHTKEYKHTYKKDSVQYKPSPYKVHSYIGYNESNDHLNTDVDIIKEKIMNV